MPAGGTTHAAPGRLRASSGRHYDRSVGCATGLGQAGAGNARINCVRCCLRKEDRYRSAFSPRPRKPGLKSRAAGESPQVRAAVERRQASASRRVRGRASCTAGWKKRLPAFRFPFFFFVSFVLSSVIAGLDPAIHAAAKRDQSFRSHLASREFIMDHRIKSVVTRRFALSDIVHARHVTPATASSGVII